MKQYTQGLLRHKCSNAMRIGKLIKYYALTKDYQPCPNCGDELLVELPDPKPCPKKVLVRNV